MNKFIASAIAAIAFAVAAPAHAWNKNAPIDDKITYCQQLSAMIGHAATGRDQGSPVGEYIEATDEMNFDDQTRTMVKGLVLNVWENRHITPKQYNMMVMMNCIQLSGLDKDIANIPTASQIKKSKPSAKPAASAYRKSPV